MFTLVKLTGLIILCLAPTIFATGVVTNVNGVNTSSEEGSVFVTPEGQTMYFSSNRSGGSGGADIYRATLSGSIWINITNLTTINSSSDDYAPWVVGNYMYFTTTRWGGYRLAQATYSGGTWGSVVQLPGFSQSGNDFGCSITADNLTMYFASTRTPSQGLYDIFKCINSGGNWGNILNIGSVINTSAYEGLPAISPDGTVLHFGRVISSNWNIFVSTWNGSSWTTPIQLPAPINIPGYASGYHCYRPELNKLFFASNRPGGSGGMDIWVSTGYNLDVQPTSLGRVKAMFQ